MVFVNLSDFKKTKIFSPNISKPLSVVPVSVQTGQDAMRLAEYRRCTPLPNRTSRSERKLGMNRLRNNCLCGVCGIYTTDNYFNSRALYYLNTTPVILLLILRLRSFLNDIS